MTRAVVGIVERAATLTLVSLVVPMAAPAVSQAQTPGFAPVEFFDTGGAGSVALTSADFNLDGAVDVATANEDADTVSVLLNSGTGDLTLDNTYPVGEQPWEIVAADFDNDTFADLAVANATSSDVSVLLNNGDGTFAAETIHAVGFTPSGITAADVSGDGNLDLVTSELDDNGVSVLVGDGSGGFDAADFVGVGLEPSGVTSGDVTGDGLSDAVVVNFSSDTVSVLVSPFDPDIGNFSEIRDLEVGFAPSRVVLVDLDLNGALDIAVHTHSVSSTGPNSVSVMLNDGGGVFQPAVEYPADGVQVAGGIATGDFNDDGVGDIAVSGLDTDNVGVLLSDGQGGLGPAAIFDAGGDPAGIIAAALTGSQAPDLAAGYTDESHVGVFANLHVPPPPPPPPECAAGGEAASAVDWVRLGGPYGADPSVLTKCNVVFAVRPNGAPSYHERIGGQWSAAIPLDGLLVSRVAPAEALVGSQDPNFEVFGNGIDGAVWYRTLHSGWQSLGGALRSDPTAVIFNGQTYVFGVGLDDAVWYRTPQTGWASLGGVLVSDLGVTTDGTSLYVTGVGIDEAIWARRMTGSTWRAWESLGGRVITAPVTTNADGTGYLFAIGRDGAVWYQGVTGGTWSGWYGLGGIAESAPAAIAHDNGDIDVFVVGIDLAMYWHHWNGSRWSGWHDRGGGFTSNPVVTTTEVFGLGFDDFLYAGKIPA